MKNWTLIVLMLAVSGTALAQQGVSCTNLTYLQETVCDANLGHGHHAYTMGALNTQEASFHRITRAQYVLRLKIEEDAAKKQTALMEEKTKKQSAALCEMYRKNDWKDLLTSSHCDSK